FRRTITIGARTSELAADGKLYSRASQAFTEHFYSVTCSAGTATGTYVTKNPPLDDTYPDIPPFNESGFGNYGWPSIDWSDHNRTYVDPLTGLLTKRVLPTYAVSRTTDNQAFQFAADLNGQWSDIGNILNGSGGPFASYSGAGGDAVFLGFPAVTIDFVATSKLFQFGPTVDDLRVNLYGSGSGSAADREVEVALTIDSGRTPYSNWVRTTLPSSTGTVSVPAGYPSALFQGWGKILPRQFFTQTTGTVNVSGTTVTLQNPSETNYFNLGWTSGDKIYISGSGAICPNELCTIAAVTDQRQLELMEDLGELTGATYRGATAGVLIRKRTSNGAIALAAKFDYAWSRPVWIPLNGVGRYCSDHAISITEDAEGAPAPARDAHLCVFNSTLGSGGVLYFPDNGETRLVTAFYGVANTDQPASDRVAASSRYTMTLNAFDQTDGRVLYTAQLAAGGKLSIFRVTYTGSGKALAYRYSNPAPAAGVEPLVWENLTPQSQGRDVQAQIVNRISSSPLYLPGAVTLPTRDEGVAGGYMIFSAGFAGGQDAGCFLFSFDLQSGDLIAAADTITSYPGRWGGCHTSKVNGDGNYTTNSAAILRKASTSAWLGGPWVIRQVKEVSKSGSWSTDTSLTSSYADVCSPELPQQWKDAGAVGPKCIKIRIAGEPCSSFANATYDEAGHFPCPWDSAKSMVQALAPGDYVMDPLGGGPSSPDGKSEKLLVVSKTDISGAADSSGGTYPAGSSELELVRWAACDELQYYGHTTASHLSTHANGWQAMMAPTWNCSGTLWWFNAAATGVPWERFNPAFTAGHNNIGAGVNSGEATVITAGYRIKSGRIPDDFLNFSGNRQVSYFPRFSGIGVGIDNDSNGIQSYPSKTNYTAEGKERYWALDFRHFNPATGVGYDRVTGLFPHSISLVPGTSRVWKINNPRGAFSRSLPRLAWAGRYLLKDKSGPGSTISDSDVWRFCEALAAGECVPDSSPGDAYMVVKSRDTTSDYCGTNNHSRNMPCFTSGSSIGAWGIQFDVIHPHPVTGMLFRRLTMGFTGPGRQWHFGNLRSTSDGKWAFVPAPWLDGVRPELLMVKLPPWPGEEGMTRSSFVRRPVTLSGSTDFPKARIKFGYAEHGAVSDLFCTSRREACVTDSQIEPFAFTQTDTLRPIDCESGCTIDLPTIPGRVLYYKVERLDNSGQVTFAGPIEALVADN
ncbi:MAG: hypothetical protein HYS04_18950, partial [Acidobacteria bacterium]|nr:hypothetical protein [Acidobacteriota bacterium]